MARDPKSSDPKPVDVDDRDDEDLVVDLDLDAQDAQIREALKEPITVKVGGRVVTFPNLKLWEADDLAALDRGDWDTVFEEMLSEKDCAHMQSLGLALYQIEKMFDVLMAKSGLNRGESQGSSRRSRRRRKK